MDDQGEQLKTVGQVFRDSVIIVAPTVVALLGHEIANLSGWEVFVGLAASAMIYAVVSANDAMRRYEWAKGGGERNVKISSTEVVNVLPARTNTSLETIGEVLSRLSPSEIGSD